MYMSINKRTVFFCITYSCHFASCIVGFAFDGYKYYDNYSETNIELAKLQVFFESPSFSVPRDSISFDPDKEDAIKIPVCSSLFFVGQYRMLNPSIAFHIF